MMRMAIQRVQTPIEGVGMGDGMTGTSHGGVACLSGRQRRGCLLMSSMAMADRGSRSRAAHEHSARRRRRKTHPACGSGAHETERASPASDAHNTPQSETGRSTSLASANSRTPQAELVFLLDLHPHSVEHAEDLGKHLRWRTRR